MTSSSRVTSDQLAAYCTDDYALYDLGCARQYVAKGNPYILPVLVKTIPGVELQHLAVYFIDAHMTATFLSYQQSTNRLYRTAAIFFIIYFRVKEKGENKRGTWRFSFKSSTFIHFEIKRTHAFKT